ncbi:unnamed protein product [Arctogadus glacialis]
MWTECPPPPCGRSASPLHVECPPPPCGLCLRAAVRGFSLLKALLRTELLTKGLQFKSVEAGRVRVLLQGLSDRRREHPPEEHPWRRHASQEGRQKKYNVTGNSTRNKIKIDTSISFGNKSKTDGILQLNPAVLCADRPLYVAGQEKQNNHGTRADWGTASWTVSRWHGTAKTSPGMHQGVVCDGAASLYERRYRTLAVTHDHTHRGTL